MLGNALTKVSCCRKDEVFAMAFYLYKLSEGITYLDSHAEMQKLYNALVDRLGIGKHAANVIDSFIKNHIANKKLTPMIPGDRYRSPYHMKGNPAQNYRQDECIYENSGDWTSSRERDVNLIRALFASEDVSFSKLIAMTFFMTPEKLHDCNRKLPSSIAISEEVKNACKNVDDVLFAKNILGLSNKETSLLQVAFRTQNYMEMYQVCNDLFRNDKTDRIQIYAKCSNLSPKEIRMMLKKDQKLTAYGLINEEGDLEEDAIDAIREKDFRLYFSDIIKQEKKAKAYELESFSTNIEKSNLALRFLKSNNSANILIYGAPGAGKTEFAKALAKQSGLNIMMFKNEIEIKDDKDNVEEKALSRLNCYLSMKRDDSVLIVDEAETILKTQGYFWGIKASLPTKGTVNKMLEESTNKVIWILNYTDELDESTLRRFTFSIKFNEMPNSTLRSIAEKKFDGIKLPKVLKNEIVDMCSSYHVTGASVENIAKAVKSIDVKESSNEQILNDVKQVLEANSNLVFGRKKIRDNVKNSYKLDILNTSIPAASIIQMIENGIADKEENPECNEGIKILFYGASGTGKTELARYISEITGKKLLLKRASDILGKYVGENEKQICEAFEEAEETDSILLFDEADSFFADRKNAETGWERTMVNEFLSQMEEFSGILICTTNLRKIMDPAMQRRFHILTEFKPLKEQGIKELLGSFFGKYRFEDNQIEALSQTESVTPGDFGQLRGKIRFMNKESINSEYIIDELMKIQSEKKKNGNMKIGFAS